jgi:hypothetical protein
MYEAFLKSKPKLLGYGKWHLPYVTDQEIMDGDVYSNNEYIEYIEYLIKLSGARCARISFLTHDGKNPNPIKDVKLYNDLVGSVPIHASPTEHQATPNRNNDFDKNFRGWHQHRADIEHRFNKGV